MGTSTLAQSRSVEFKLGKAALNRHLLIIAQSGFGKTHLIYHILRSPALAGIPTLVVDLKRDYTGLLNYREDFKYCNWEHFRFNPLNQKGIPKQTIKSNLIAAFSDTFQLLESSKSYFQYVLEDLFDVYGI